MARTYDLAHDVFRIREKVISTLPLESLVLEIQCEQP
jgi:hypothetical protein